MKRVTLYVLAAVLAGVHLLAQPALAQKRGDDGDGSEVEHRVSKQEKTRLDLMYSEFSNAMAWELKTGKDQSDEIHRIIGQFKRSGATGGKRDVESEIRKLRAEVRRANKAKDNERADEIRQEMRELERKANPLPAELLYRISDLLSEPLRTDFWQISERFINGGKIHLGAYYLEALTGLELTDKQGMAISLHYKTYLDEMWNADSGHGDLLAAAQTSLQTRILDELNQQQRAAFREALETQHRNGDNRNTETSSRW